MTASVSNDLLAPLSGLVASATGLDYPPDRWKDLSRGLAATASGLGSAEPEVCARQLLAKPLNRRLLESLVRNLTVGETYFFRDGRSFDALKDVVLPELIRSREQGSRYLRLWCAGCCTGEEAYSIAITIRRLLPDISAWNVTILATDINTHFLHSAEAGRYGDWSFRESPALLIGKYINRAADGGFAVVPEIRRMIRFSQLNLADDCYPSAANDTNAMDIIFCRNVLMYFARSRASEVMHRLYRAQSDDGWLFVSPSELLHCSSSPYARVDAGGALLYRKSVARPAEGRSTGAVATGLCGAEISSASQRGGRVASVVADRGDVLNDGNAAARSADPLKLYDEGLYREAATQLRERLGLGGADAETSRLLIRTLANQGKLAEALSCCDQLLAGDKLSARSHYLKAAILREQSRLDEAAASLRSALYLDPDFTLAHFESRNIAHQQGRFEEARRHLRNTMRSLMACQPTDTVPESEGMAAGRLMDIVKSLLGEEDAR